VSKLAFCAPRFENLQEWRVEAKNVPTARHGRSFITKPLGGDAEFISKRFSLAFEVGCLFFVVSQENLPTCPLLQFRRNIPTRHYSNQLPGGVVAALITFPSQ